MTVQVSYLVSNMVEAVVIVDDIIGNRQSLFPACLSRNNALGLVNCFRIACQQSPDLSFFFAIHDEYAINKLHKRRTNE